VFPINIEARDRFLSFATAAGAAWMGNLRDLNAAVARMATFAAEGRITTEIVDGEMTRLKSSWSLPVTESSSDDLDVLLGEYGLSTLDPFARVQLAEVLRVCRMSGNLSEAGRQIFSISRTKKGTTNDADRLRKYLARFSLD
jgi:transcriptional regulatory protein RtcR